MKDFFMQLLENLHLIAGLRQLENIYATYSDTPEGQTKANKEVAELIKTLCEACAEHSYIPVDQQQKIIVRESRTDKEYKSLNYRVVWGWLDKNKHLYFKEEAHKESAPSAPPVTGEVREKYINQLLEAISKVGNPQTTRAPVKEMLQSLPKGEAYKPNDEYAIQRELHLQYIRENYDKYTGNKLPTWVSEQEWLKQKQ